MKKQVQRAVLGFSLITLTVLSMPLQARLSVPFRGKATGAITSISPGSGGLDVTTLAEGTATHLGNFVREETAVLDPLTGTISGQMVWTAANGDQLFTTVDGGFISPSVVTGVYVITGGTGRFENASGQIEFILSTPDGIHYSVQFQGSLNK